VSRSILAGAALRAWSISLGLLAAACGAGMPEPPPGSPRVKSVEPTGDGVPAALAAASVAFSAPVSPEGLTDGARLVLVPASAEKAALAAVESEEGAAGLAGAARGTVALEDGGRRAVLRLSAPLHALVPYVLVVGTRIESTRGKAVLDADGHRKPTVAPFTTGASTGPAARPVIAQVRTDAETPEASGEYVIVVNRGEGPLDLFGRRLEKRSPSGGVSSCALGEGEVAPGGLALVVGTAYDERYSVPAGTAIVPCGPSAALAGGLANDRFPSLRLLDPLGAVLSTAGAAGGPVCAIALRVELDGPDEPANWECVEGD
jgi:hypothetical protein